MSCVPMYFLVLVLSAGARLGPFEILSALGFGGMGEVYRASDPRLGRDVAIKVLPGELADDPDRLSRFEQESRSASALNHPNIVTIYDVGREGSSSYIAMELVEGQSLRELLAGGPLDPRQAVAIATQIAEGLARAHSARIVHRDLKPENVMVTPDGLVKILDFGLAKLSPETDPGDVSAMATLAGATSPGIVLGTAGYMSPEQAVGRAVDFRSDQFSLGAIAYELVAGRRPFQRETLVETLSAILKDEPPPLTASQANEGLRRIIERCLAKNPDDRYGSTRDLARDLADLRDRASQSGSPVPPLSPGPGVPRSRFFRAWILGALLVTASGIAFFAFLRARPPVPAERSLAILPLQNLSGLADDEYFADGITESLITNVAKGKDLLVIARNSVFAYKGKSVDARKVGGELGVRYVLEGSVQRAGGQVRINAQLIDARTGYHLWAEKYDRRLTDIFALQDDISNKITQSLAVAIAPAGTRPGRAGPKNVDAYDAFLRGQSHFHRGIAEADVDAAIATLERSVRIEPGFARAHAELANAYSAKYFHYDPRPEWEQRASAHVEKALELDPHLAEGYVARGNLFWTLAHGFPHERAIADFRRALEINPSLADAHRYLGRVLYHLGFFDEALAELNQALRVDPKDTWVLSRIEGVYLLRQDFEKALAYLDAHPGLGADGDRAVAYAHLGREKESFEAIARALRSEPENEDFLAIHALLLARRGDAAAAEKEIARAIDAGQGKGHFHHSEYWFGCAYAAMGRKKEAVEWLEKAAYEGLPCYPLFRGDPFLDGLRDDPDFQALLLRMKKEWERYRATL